MAAMDDETRIKLVGLRTLADELQRQLVTLRRATARLVGEDPEEAGSHSDDFCYDSAITPDHLWSATAKSRKATE